MSHISLNQLIFVRKHSFVLTFVLFGASAFILRQIKLMLSLSKDVMQLIIPCWYVMFLGVCAILDKYISTQLDKQIRVPTYSSEDQEMAEMIANEDVRGFFSRVRPKKLFLIANNLCDTNSADDTVQKFPWESLSNSGMRPLIEIFKFEDKKKSDSTFRVISQTGLPQDIIFSIMEYMDIAPFLLNDKTKKELEEKLVCLYDSLQGRIENARSRIYETLTARYIQEEVARLDSISLSLTTQKNLMISQYKTFIGDVLIEAKQEFIRRNGLEQPKISSKKQSGLRLG